VAQLPRLCLSTVGQICLKELRRYFASLIAYVLLSGTGLLLCLVIYAADRDFLRQRLAGPVYALSSFSPSRELIQHRVTFVAGFTRVVAMFLIPMITMRLFIEEKETRTIEMLFTSPVRDVEIILGKWLGAMVLFLSIIALSLLELAVSFHWNGADWWTVFVTYAGIVIPGFALLSIGEYISSVTKHQAAAAVGTFLVCLVVLRYYSKGVLHRWDFVFCSALAVVGWLLTWRSIQALRGTF